MRVYATPGTRRWSSARLSALMPTGMRARVRIRASPDASAGDRQFIIEPRDAGTVSFTHVEDVHGLLFPLFRALMGRAIRT